MATITPQARHSQICYKTFRILENHVENHDNGHVLSNDFGVITERGPDSVRGVDVSFYSYARIPRGPLPKAHPAVMPDLVVVVRSPDDRWAKVLKKVAEYLEAGINIVCVLDEKSRTAQVHDSEQAVRILNEHDDLTFPALLPDFRVPLRRFFE